MTPSKGVGVVADSEDSVGALAESGGVAGLILWSSTGRVTDSSSSTGRGGKSLRVGDGKLSSKQTMPELTNNSSFRVPNPITASVVLVAHKETHSRSVVKLLQQFLRLDNGTRLDFHAIEHLVRPPNIRVGVLLCIYVAALYLCP